VIPAIEQALQDQGPSKSIKDSEYATLKWVDWLNHRRLLELIGNIPPAEAEANYFAALKEAAIAACLQPNSLRGCRRGSGERAFSDLIESEFGISRGIDTGDAPVDSNEVSK
jgi:hypothetical protein